MGVIYQDVQSRFEALSGSLVLLGQGLDDLSDLALRIGLVNPAADLQTDAADVQLAASAAHSDAVKVPSQRPMSVLSAWARSRFDTVRAVILAQVQSRLDALPGPVRASAEYSRADDLVRGLDRLVDETTSLLEEASIVPDGPGYNLGRLRSTVDDIASYPVLTTEVSGGGGGPGPSARAGSTVAHQVDAAVREVLGRLPKYTDATAFTAALSSTFALQEVGGHTVVTWRPRGFTGQAELGGAVSGAQASLYGRARDALSAALPVLAGLTPLRPDADTEEMDAARAVVESQFRAVVDELGTPGGPRRNRVDGLFEILLNQPVRGIDGTPVAGGMIGYLGNVFGLEAGQVNTIDEEQVFSGFLLLRDYVVQLRSSWTQFDTVFRQRDLGTQLVLLSNSLQVVAESVDEVEAALDSVFVGVAERGVASFAIGGGRSMLVCELLSWVSTFAASEAPELVQQGGRRAMGAVESTANELVALIEHLESAIAARTGLPIGMSHPRVRHPLEELRTYLRQVVQIAADIRVPH